MKKLISALVILTYAVSISAAIINIDANGNGDYPTIQAAINASGNGNEIILLPGTYTGPGNRDIDFLGKAITVRSENGPENCIIDCNGTESEPHRGFYFHSGEDANSILDGLTVTNGLIQFGGGILCENSSPTIKNCIFIRNSAFKEKYGGAGGAMANSYSEPLIINCKFIENTASGAVYGHGVDGGGAIINEFFGPEVRSCTFIGNSAGIGGAINNWALSKDLKISNSAFIKNSAMEGGAIWYKGGDVIINNCTFSLNSATDEGGAIYFYYGATLGLLNSILWDDTAPDGNEITFWYYSTLDVNFCNIKGGSSEIYKRSSSTLNWGMGNIDLDPCFVNPDINDFHLLPDSPCINTGDPNYIPEPNETDLDGLPRIIDGRIDMGAYELKLPDLKARLWLWPPTLNCNSGTRYVTIMMCLPKSVKPSDVDNQPLAMHLCDIQAKYQRIFSMGHDRYARTVIMAVFEKDQICDCLDIGWHKVDMAGRLQSGRYFCGSGMLRIISPYPHRWPFLRFYNRH